MRAIPSELLERVKKKWQVPAENADPAMKVYLSRGFINELFQVFTIQEGAELTDVDVTVKRTDTSAEPAEAYALAINDGVAQVKSKPLPYDDQIPWVDRMTVALSATSVAIEFDGYWDRDYATRRFNFVTEEYPWLFYVQGGTLYAKYWEDAEITLATDVVKVCAIRGWLPANGDQSNDQGLIVAYIKADGLVYYRSYCIQVGGGKLWEVERNVAEILTTCTDLALFRTNDFRIGFMISTGGVMYWLLTARNWAGMSIWPDTIIANVSLEVDLIQITFTDSFAPDETITADVEYTAYLCGVSLLDIAPTGINRISTTELEIQFGSPLYNVTGSESGFVVSNDTETTFFTVASVGFDGVSNKLSVTTSETLDPSVNVKVAYIGDLNRILVSNSATCKLELSSFSIIDEGAPQDGHTTETITANVQAAIVFTPITRSTGYTNDETITASVSVVVGFYELDDAPI